MASIPFSLDKQDAIHIAKVAGWSISSVILTGLIALLAQVHIDQSKTFLVFGVSLINIILVSFQRFVANNTTK